jgi:hypothetical protein
MEAIAEKPQQIFDFEGIAEGSFKIKNTILRYSN